jgi:type II secretory pathway pseudopilin PulG
MKTYSSKPKTGFTIIELLTVMSIIILLISLLVPALNRVRRYALLVKQKAQFHAISIALDLFNAEELGYPPSNSVDTAPAPGPNPYCGAMKLAEAMIGQDFLGFHPDSQFRRDGLITNPSPPPANLDLYPFPPLLTATDIKLRKPYLQLENANATKLVDIYTQTHRNGTAYQNLSDNDANLVLCDVYVKTMATGNKVGMPILYFKANTSKTDHIRVPPNPVADLDLNIYDRRDNQDLVDIPLPWVTPVGPVHPMASAGNTIFNIPADAGIFYDETRDKKIASPARPYRADSYILMSAGFDNEYGTDDDVFNFND